MSSREKYDVVAGYHLNYLTCGIAKFNLMLAEKMGVPFFNLYDPRIEEYERPLVSIKVAEFTIADAENLTSWIDRVVKRKGYDLFLHGFDHSPEEVLLVRHAGKVFSGNIELEGELKKYAADVMPMWCPGMNLNSQNFIETEITLFSFGMAHKLKVEKYYLLKDLLERTGKSYSIYLSTALHEGTAFDESFIEVFNEMTDIFGDRVFFLGYLSDQAVFNYLHRCDYFVAFFERGLRANNTSVNFALENGVSVITNLDENSPQCLKHMMNIIDIGQVESLDIDEVQLQGLRLGAAEVAKRELSWDVLVDRLRQ